MNDLILITGVPMIITLVIKCIYIKTTTKEERKENIDLMSSVINYEDYVKINNDIIQGI